MPSPARWVKVEAMPRPRQEESLGVILDMDSDGIIEQDLVGHLKGTLANLERDLRREKLARRKERSALEERSRAESMHARQMREQFGVAAKVLWKLAALPGPSSAKRHFRNQSASPQRRCTCSYLHFFLQGQHLTGFDSVKFVGCRDELYDHCKQVIDCGASPKNRYHSDSLVRCCIEFCRKEDKKSSPALPSTQLQTPPISSPLTKPSGDVVNRSLAPSLSSDDKVMKSNSLSTIGTPHTPLLTIATPPIQHTAQRSAPTMPRQVGHLDTPEGTPTKLRSSKHLGTKRASLERSTALQLTPHVISFTAVNQSSRKRAYEQVQGQEVEARSLGTDLGGITGKTVTENQGNDEHLKKQRTSKAKNKRPAPWVSAESTSQVIDSTGLSSLNPPVEELKALFGTAADHWQRTRLKNFPIDERLSDGELIDIGRVANGTARVMQAPYTFGGKKGRLMAEYYYLALLKEAKTDGFMWSEAELSRIFSDASVRCSKVVWEYRMAHTSRA